MHARDGDWESVITRIREIVGERENVPDEYLVDAVFVTGSLAYGGGTPNESDVDLVIGDNREYADYSLDVVGTVTQILQDHEGDLTELIGLPVTTVHIVEVVPARRAPHRAMELQHHGQQLARQHNVDKDVKMRIYDAVHDEVFSDARSTSY